MCCSAAGIWDTPLLIIMKWEKAKAYFWKRSSLFLTELIISSEGVWGFKKQQQQRTEEESIWKWNIAAEKLEVCDVMWWVSYCGDPFLNYFIRKVISPLFPCYKTTSIWHLFQRALFFSSTDRHQWWLSECADISVFRTVRSNRRKGLDGLVYAIQRNVPYSFLLQKILFPHELNHIF